MHKYIYLELQQFYVLEKEQTEGRKLSNFVFMFSGSRGIPEPRSFDAVRQMVRGTGLPQKKQTLPLYEYIREKITKITQEEQKGLFFLK